VESVNHAYANGLLVTSASWSEPLGRWLVIFSRHVAGQKSRGMDGKAMTAEVQGLWDEGLRNLRLFPAGDDGWRVVASSESLVKRLSGTRERWSRVVSSCFPASTVQELWDAGYALTGVSAVGDRWAFTAREPEGAWRQHWKTGSFEEVKAYCAEKWGEGGSLVVCGFGGGRWFAVTDTENRGAEALAHVKPQTAVEKLASIRAKGRHISAVHADDDGWLVVSCERPDWSA
jgi:hypothetical protein